MMRAHVILMLGFTILVRSISGANEWDVTLIADSMKTDANAVIRLYTVSYERSSVDRYSMDIHLVITILNKAGNDASELYVRYDRNTEVAKFEGSIFNAAGAEIANISKKDLDDFAITNSYTLYSDNRVKYYMPSVTQYPYTVSYTYKVNYRGVVGFAPWLPLRDFDISAEKASLTFLTPVQFELQCKTLNFDFAHSLEKEGDKLRYRWSASALPAISSETHMPDYLEVFPAVLLSPFDISYEGTTGNFSDWKSYGMWVYDLIRDRGQIPDETYQKIRAMTDTIPDRLEKIRMVYRYVQDNTRYVNISLGIGGFQPIPASDVDEKGYGDCKALSNYTKALLQSIGINSYYAEIGNGDTRRIKFPDFASVNQTNHVILCVPNNKDTIWLECTNQNIPFGYIGSGNANRYALLVTEEGGKLARTPAYPKETNTRVSRINSSLKANGEADFNMDIEFSNYLYEQVFGLLHTSPREQNEALLAYLPYDGLALNDIILKDISTTQAMASFHASGSIGKYATKAGNRMLVEPVFFFDNTFAKGIAENRNHLFLQDLGYTCVDTLHIAIPSSFQVEFLPEDYSVTTNYGNYSIQYRVDSGNVLIVTRNIQVNEGKYDQEDFNEINEFVAAISKQNKDRIILVENRSL